MHVLTAAWIRTCKKVIIRVELLLAYASGLGFRYAHLCRIVISLSEEESVKIIQILICD